MYTFLLSIVCDRADIHDHSGNIFKKKATTQLTMIHFDLWICNIRYVKPVFFILSGHEFDKWNRQRIESNETTHWNRFMRRRMQNNWLRGIENCTAVWWHKRSCNCRCRMAMKLTNSISATLDNEHVAPMRTHNTLLDEIRLDSSDYCFPVEIGIAFHRSPAWIQYMNKWSDSDWFTKNFCTFHCGCRLSMEILNRLFTLRYTCDLTALRQRANFGRNSLSLMNTAVCQVIFTFLIFMIFWLHKNVMNTHT